MRSAFLQIATIVLLLTSKPLLCRAVCPSAMHQTTLANFVVNQEGTRIAAVGHDGTLFWWDTRKGTRTELLDCIKFSGLNPALSFSLASSLLAVAGSGGVLLFDIASGKLLRTLDGKCPNAEYMVFSGNGDRLATSSDEGVCVWHVLDGKRLFFLPGRVERFAFRLDQEGRSLFIAKDHRIERWNVDNNAITTSIVLPAGETAAAIALDDRGRMLVTQLRHSLPVHPGDTHSRFQYQFAAWDVETGKEQERFGEETGELAYPLQTLQSQKLLASTYDGIFYVWDLEMGRLIRRLKAGVVAMSGDGHMLAKTRIGIPFRVELWNIGEPQSQARSLFYRSPTCEAVEPEKTRFEITLTGDSRTQASAMVGWQVFVSQDCTPVSYSHAWMDSPEQAAQ
ncbi:MAG TPA: hypothetical protein VFI72_15595, partial [Candidatus Angelobacter sp.]|nr:hypothetical protein [Candidatus Angelobacter sp.]